MSRPEVIQSFSGVDEIRVTRYRCEGCRRSWSDRSAAVKHKARCWKHEDNKGCGSCVYAQKYYEDGSVMHSCALDLDTASVETGYTILTINCPSWSSWAESQVL
jgi:hypothetical protein